MKSRLKKFANSGGLVAGEFAMDFKFLLEAGLLPGAMMRKFRIEIHLPARFIYG